MADEHYHEDFLGKSNQALVYEYASKQMPEVFADARSDVDVVVVYRVTPLIDSRLRGQFPNVKLRFCFGTIFTAHASGRVRRGDALAPVGMPRKSRISRGANRKTKAGVS
jgi:hypothetical protein